jgi:hypothetical protein
VREITPWLVVCANCFVMPFGMFMLAWWLRGKNIRIKVESQPVGRIEDRTGPTARQSVLKQIQTPQQRREEAIGYGDKPKP